MVLGQSETRILCLKEREREIERIWIIVGGYHMWTYVVILEGKREREREGRCFKNHENLIPICLLYK